MNYLKFIIIIGLSLLSMSVSAKGKAGEFDYYLMALSWSPDYCASHQSDENQCSAGKQLGFVLHGVWPQYTQGYPSSCSTVKIDSQQCSSVYPSLTLCEHEWDKHGTCSGLSPDEYVSFSKQLKDNITIPTVYTHPEQPFRVTIDDLKNEFIKSNPSLTANGIAPACSGAGRFLQEVRICFSKDGKTSECSAEVLSASKKSCGQPDFLVRNIK